MPFHPSLQVFQEALDTALQCLVDHVMQAAQDRSSQEDTHWVNHTHSAIRLPLQPD